MAKAKVKNNINLEKDTKTGFVRSTDRAAFLAARKRKRDRADQAQKDQDKMKKMEKELKQLKKLVSELTKKDK